MTSRKWHFENIVRKGENAGILDFFTSYLFSAKHDKYSFIKNVYLWSTKAIKLEMSEILTSGKDLDNIKVKFMASTLHYTFLSLCCISMYSY